MGKMTQWEYALLLLPFADGMDEEKIMKMSKGERAIWIEKTKEVRRDTLYQMYGEASDDLQRTGDILPIANEVTTLQSQGTRSFWHCGPCPKCKGDDRFFVNTRTNWFECRKCNFRGGVVTLAAYAWGGTTWDAIDQLTGSSLRDEPVRVRRTIRQCQQAPQAPQAPQQREYRDYSDVMRGVKRALLSASGQAARAYLATERGLQAQTWELHDVGLTSFYSRQSVAFGHWVGDVLVGVNQRKIGVLGKDEPKSMFMKGHTWGLFHLERIEGARVLIVVEGELNGLSIWQVAREGGLVVDVIAVGPEKALKKLSGEISRIAQGYEGVLIWADRKDIAVSARQKLRFDGNVIAIQSPAGLDANDLLLRGQLSDFVAHYVRTCEPVSRPISQNQQILPVNKSINEPINEPNDWLEPDEDWDNFVYEPTKSNPYGW